MKNFNLTEIEERGLIGLLYNQVSILTTQEILGELKEEGLTKAELQRNILVKLLKKYSLLDTLSPENLLILGMVNCISKENLIKISKKDLNKHLSNRAKFFIKKYDQ
jgi:hypothetical protein